MRKIEVFDKVRNATVCTLRSHNANGHALNRGEIFQFKAKKPEVLTLTCIEVEGSKVQKISMAEGILLLRKIKTLSVFTLKSMLHKCFFQVSVPF